MKQSCRLSPLLGNILLEVLPNTIRKEKNKRYTDWKERRKVPLFADDMIAYVQNPKNQGENISGSTMKPIQS